MKLNIGQRISEFIPNAIRVLKLLTKPKKDEYFLVAKITGLAILLIGFIGYIIETIKYVITGAGL